ncbi:uncharacterized protein LOC141863105 [Acropora palmata]|uniref:uncharacterized protein LOC141863105 n=1 Tax=Acropora palmata TaxID=6131 RepID=UPI003DA05FD9
MVTSCCVPECNQKGKKTSTGEKVSFFEFPRTPLRKTQWIHAIRREEGKQFKIVDGTKVCSLHFRREDIRKSFNGRAYVVAGGIPSRFAWSVHSPRKRKAPPKRHPLPPKKKLFTTTSTSSQAELVSETDAMVESVTQLTSTASNSKSNRNTDLLISNCDTDLEFNVQKKIEDMEQELLKLRQENTGLKKKLDELEKQHEVISARLFCLERFTSDADSNFYTGLPNYATFLGLFNFLDPDEDGENIRPRSTLKDVAEDFYDADSEEEENVTLAKKGRPRKLKPVEEFSFDMLRIMGLICILPSVLTSQQSLSKVIVM